MAEKVYQVSIENCLLGTKYILANSEQDAIEKYKLPCGITSHAGVASVKPTDFDPKNLPDGIELFTGRPQPTHETVKATIPPATTPTDVTKP